MNIRHKIRKTWRHDDILILLNLWNGYERKLRTLKRNSHIYDKLAALLRNRGVNATSTEVHFKINNLKQKYRKDELYGVTSWRYFENVKEILQNSKTSMNQESTQNLTNNYAVQTPSNPTKICSAPPVSKIDSPSIPKPSSFSPKFQKLASNLANKNNVSTSTSKRKVSLKRALLEEVRRGNDIAARDQEVPERLLRQANKVNQEWSNLMREFMNRTLTILEKNFAAPQNYKTS